YGKVESKNNSLQQSDLQLFIFDAKGNYLNYSICSNNQIKINLPIKQDSPISPYLDNAKYIHNLTNADIFNPQDNFYNEKCFGFSDNDTDLTLNDRRKEIFPNVTIQCSVGCTYQGINY